MTVEVIELIGSNSDVVELLEQAKAGKLAHGMRQRVDADTELPNGVRLLEDLAVEAA